MLQLKSHSCKYFMIEVSENVYFWFALFCGTSTNIIMSDGQVLLVTENNLKPVFPYFVSTNSAFYWILLKILISIFTWLIIGSGSWRFHLFPALFIQNLNSKRTFSLQFCLAAKSKLIVCFVYRDTQKIVLFIWRDKNANPT